MAVLSRVEIAVNVYKTKTCDLQIDIRTHATYIFSLVPPIQVNVAIGVVVTERYGSLWCLLIDSFLHLLTLVDTYS